MSSISRLRGRLADWLGGEQRASTSAPTQWLIDWVQGGVESSSGVKINPVNALKYSPFWAAVRIISGTVASLPLLVYRKKDGGKERATDHKVYALLHDSPNDYMDALTFLETRMAHVLCYGNGYAEIQRDGAGRPVALWPLLPDRTFRSMSKSGVPYYEIQPLKGDTVYLPDDAVLHIKGLGFDGYTGYDVVAYHKNTIGYGVAVKEYGARYFANDASPGGVLQHPTNLSDKALKHLTESWNRQHAGMGNKHRLAILEEGMKWQQTGVDPDKSQSLEVQKYNVEDCSRIFNIPPFKLGDYSRATHTNVEEGNLDFLTTTMYYWFRKWEQEINRKLFLPGERGRLFAEFLVDAMQRGNTTTRYSSYAIGRQWGWLSVNDVRRHENMNSIGPEGDTYLEPLNMAPVGSQEDKPAGSSTAGSDNTAAGSTAAPKKAPLEPTRFKIIRGLDGSAVWSAHRGLIAEVWGRIIRKQNGAVAKGVPDGWWADHRQYARTILDAPACAFASVYGISMKSASAAVADIVMGGVKDSCPLIEPDDADNLAERMMRRIKDSQDNQ